MSGRVQGVFFRVSTRNRALELGLTGTVQNQKDGSVRIVTTGQEDAIEQLTLWCHRGPELARVDHVVVNSIGLTPFDSFTILR